MSKNLKHEYFNWIVKVVKGSNYRPLLMLLDDIPFEYSIPMDSNREADGISLRYAFAEEMGYDYVQVAHDIDSRPCSVLEMLVALARRCERDLMANPEEGDRSSIWFWEMVDNLELRSIGDDYINRKDLIEFIIKRFLERSYSYEGFGNIFVIRYPEKDMRGVEIWTQMNWYMERYHL